MSESLRGGSHATPESRRPAPPPDVADLDTANGVVDTNAGMEEVEDLSGHTVAALRVIAQELDVPRYAKLRKADLVAAIETARASG